MFIPCFVMIVIRLKKWDPTARRSSPNCVFQVPGMIQSFLHWMFQKLRKDENYEILFECSERVKGFTIAPLLLIPFIENAFKYVSHHHEKNAIRITLDKTGERFQVNVFNTKQVKPRNGVAHEGIGLKNVSRMLELLYKDRHTLSIKNSEDSYEVDLVIDISTKDENRV